MKRRGRLDGLSPSELIVRRLSYAALLVVAGCFAQSGSATGSPAAGTAMSAGWQPATTLYSANPGDSLRVGLPRVVVDRRGRATAVWLYGSSSGAVVMEADWSPTGGWTPARALSAFGTDISRQPLALAVDARGDAVIAWSANDEVRASYRTAGGDWQPPHTLSLGGDPEVGIDDRGRVLVMWYEAQGSPGANHDSLKVVARGRSGRWGTPRVICRCDADGSLAMNARGLALVVWAGFHNGLLWDRTRSPAGRWSTPQKISSNAFSAALALNSRGDAVVSFEVGSLKFPAGELTVAIRPANGRFGKPQTIGGDAYWGTDLALAPTGEAVIMWHNGGCCLYAVSRLPGAASFTSQQTLDSAQGYGDAMPEAIAVDAHGNALALWLRAAATPIGEHGYGHLYLHAAQRPAGGRFDSGSDVGDVGEDSYKHSACNGSSTLATTPDGHAVAVWLERTTIDGCTIVEAATFNP